MTKTQNDMTNNDVTKYENLFDPSLYLDEMKKRDIESVLYYIAGEMRKIYDLRIENQENLTQQSRKESDRISAEKISALTKKRGIFLDCAAIACFVIAAAKSTPNLQSPWQVMGQAFQASVNHNKQLTDAKVAKCDHFYSRTAEMTQRYQRAKDAAVGEEDRLHQTIQNFVHNYGRATEMMQRSSQ